MAVVVDCLLQLQTGLSQNHTLSQEVGEREWERERDHKRERERERDQGRERERERDQGRERERERERESERREERYYTGGVRSSFSTW